MLSSFIFVSVSKSRPTIIQWNHKESVSQNQSLLKTKANQSFNSFTSREEGKNPNHLKTNIQKPLITLSINSRKKKPNNPSRIQPRLGHDFALQCPALLVGSGKEKGSFCSIAHKSAIICAMHKPAVHTFPSVSQVNHFRSENVQPAKAHGKQKKKCCWEGRNP